MYQVKICMHENKNYTPLKISSTQCKFENGKVAISTAFKVKLQQIRESTVHSQNCYLATAIFSALHDHFWNMAKQCKLKVISPNVTEYLLCLFDEIGK